MHHASTPTLTSPCLDRSRFFLLLFAVVHMRSLPWLCQACIPCAPLCCAAQLVAVRVVRSGMVLVACTLRRMSHRCLGGCLPAGASLSACVAPLRLSLSFHLALSAGLVHAFRHATAAVARYSVMRYDDGSMIGGFSGCSDLRTRILLVRLVCDNAIHVLLCYLAGLPSPFHVCSWTGTSSCLFVPSEPFARSCLQVLCCPFVL